MPIRFRCVYCDKLLGIARRKAGAVVNCPQCGQPLIVPTPEPEATAAASQPAAPPAAPGKLFEQDDFDVLLEPDATYRTPDPTPAAKRPAAPPPPTPPPPRPSRAEQACPPAPPAFPAASPPTPRAPSGGIVLSTGMLILAL